MDQLIQRVSLHVRLLQPKVFNQRNTKSSLGNL